MSTATHRLITRLLIFAILAAIVILGELVLVRLLGARPW